MKIELNREYLTREGNRITVTGIDADHHLPIKCSDGERRNAAGLYNSEVIPHPLDLLYPCKERPRLYYLTFRHPTGHSVTYSRTGTSPEAARSRMNGIAERDGLEFVDAELVEEVGS